MAVQIETRRVFNRPYDAATKVDQLDAPQREKYEDIKARTLKINRPFFART